MWHDESRARYYYNRFLIVVRFLNGKNIYTDIN